MIKRGPLAAREGHILSAAYNPRSCGSWPSTGALLPVEKTSAPAVQNNGVIDEALLFERVAAIIENRKSRAAAYANSEVTLMFWEIGQHINSVVLGNERAAYGKQILSALASKLSWSHFTELIRVKTSEARIYYAEDAAWRMRKRTSRLTKFVISCTMFVEENPIFMKPFPAEGRPIGRVVRRVFVFRALTIL